jgi:hypothetical protein
MLARLFASMMLAPLATGCLQIGALTGWKVDRIKALDWPSPFRVKLFKNYS